MPLSPGRALVVLNPACGPGRPGTFRARLEAALATVGATCDVVETSGPGDGTRLARQGVRDGYATVVSAGGDGTLAEVVTGTAGSGVPIGILPGGTGNQVAGNLALPQRLDEALGVALDGVPTPMDVGRLEDGRYFALAAGAGWDGELMAGATRELKDRWGFGAYLYAGLRSVAGIASARFRVEADEEVLEVSAATVIVANVPHLFFDFLPVDLRIAPRGSLSDGLLDLCIFAPRTLPEVATLLWKVARHRYGDERMLFRQARRVRIEADVPVAAEVDGDPAGTTPIGMEAVPGGVLVRTAGGAVA